MPVSRRTSVYSELHCPEHTEALVLTVRRLNSERLQWICMDCGKRLGDAGPVDHSRDKFRPGE